MAGSTADTNSLQLDFGTPNLTAPNSAPVIVRASHVRQFLISSLKN